MNPKFAAMMAKKRDMKPSEKHAKMGVLNDLKSSLADSMNDKMDGMKKVSVMSNSPQGLSAGLDKAKQMAGQPQDPTMMSEGGIAMNSDPNETDKVSYDGTPHDDGFESPNPNEAYSTGMSMDNDKKSAQDSEEPEHVEYDGSEDEEEGPGYFKGGEVGPNEADASDVTYSGNPDDDGFEHEDSDEADHGASYADGGRVKTPTQEAADSVDDEREETEGDQGDDTPLEFKGLSMQDVEEKLQHLMRIKKQMEQQ